MVLVPHMSKQLIFASTDDLALLLGKRTVNLKDLSGPARAAALTCLPGAVAIVHDPAGLGALPDGPLPLVLAGMRSISQPGFVEIVVKNAEAASLLKRLVVKPTDAEPVAPAVEADAPPAAEPSL